MKELNFTYSQVEEMTIAELSLYYVVTDPEKRKKMGSLAEAQELWQAKDKLTGEEYLEFMERKYRLWR